MDATVTGEQLKKLQDEAIEKALAISHAAEEEDIESHWSWGILSLFYIEHPTTIRKNKLVTEFRDWLKRNSLTPKDCQIGHEFVTHHLPEYSSLY
jgi:hypothetical protein